MLSKNRFSIIIGENIRRYRLDKGFTQDELAGKAGFYRTYINLVETAKRTPSSYNLHRIAKALKVTVDKIYPKFTEK